MIIDIYKTVAVVGYQKGAAQGAGGLGQLVRCWYGSPERPDEWTEVQMGKDDGVYLNEMTKQPIRWWAAELWLAAGDTLKVETRLARIGVGQDGNRSADLMYRVDPAAPLVEVAWPGVGFKDYYLLKGYLVEIMRSTKAEQRRIREIDPVVAHGFDETRKAER